MKKSTLICIITLSIIMGICGGLLAASLLGSHKSYNVSFNDIPEDGTIISRDYYMEIITDPREYNGIYKYSNTTFHFYGCTEISPKE